MMNLQFKITLLTLGLFLSCTVFGREIAPDVRWEKGTISIKPCELRFSLSEQWTEAPKELFDTSKYRGFMMGRLGLKDKNGSAVIPTLAVAWEKVDLSKPLENPDDDPLCFYSLNNRPDYHSKEYALEKIFIWQNGPLTMRYATGWQYHVVLNGRPSKAIAVYTINRNKNLGIRIMLEIPEEVWPEMKNEIEKILKSFEATSPKTFGKRESFFATTKQGTTILDFRNHGEKGPSWDGANVQCFRKNP